VKLLDRIIADRQNRQPLSVNIYKLERMLEDCTLLPPVCSLQAALGGSPAVIAEIKKRSPSRSEFAGFREPQDLARGYESAGAAAISVLTNETFFGMRKLDLQEVAAAVEIPVLRKEFIISEFDVLESRLLGADAVLLIVRLLNEVRLATLMGLATQIGLEVLLEVHSQAELESALELEPKLIGINARNLDSLQLDPDAALELCCQVPKDITIVAESGIGSRRDMQRYMQHGVGNFLIGTDLLIHELPEQRLAELLKREQGHESR
jgi:indole-3-glycerol phosphate synthase